MPLHLLGGQISCSWHRSCPLKRAFVTLDCECHLVRLQDHWSSIPCNGQKPFEAGVSTSWASLKGVSLEDSCTMASWASLICIAQVSLLSTHWVWSSLDPQFSEVSHEDSSWHHSYVSYSAYALPLAVRREERMGYKYNYCSMSPGWLPEFPITQNPPASICVYDTISVIFSIHIL